MRAAFLLLLGLLAGAVVGWLLKTSVNSSSREYAIGVYRGGSLRDLAPYSGNPVLTGSDVDDARAKFVADPFMVKRNGRWYMFFEVWNKDTDQGDIGLAASDDGLDWEYDSIVLDEPFLLSYPQVFESSGRMYMLPESNESGAIRLYESDSFPRGWKLSAELVQGRFMDPTIFRAGAGYYILATEYDDSNFGNGDETLRLFAADDLRGPWREHPASPVVAGNPNNARGAGPVLELDGALLRLAQDDYPQYGLAVHAFRIVELDGSAYAEKRFMAGPLIEGQGSGWNAGGMHHIDVHALGNGKLLACADGWRNVRFRERLKRLATFD